MNTESNPENLLGALKDLETWLHTEGIVLELQIIGSFAFYLQGANYIRTRDIDTIQDLDEKIIERIKLIASQRGLVSLWLNDNSFGIPRPEGFESRLLEIKIGEHLILKIASRKDLIMLKAAAYIDRGNENPKDLVDLKRLNPSSAEIDEAIRFIQETRRPEKPKFYPNYQEMIEDIRNVGR